MEEPKLNEEDLIDLSEEEKQKKLAELQRKKDEYWEARYKRNVYEFGDYDGPEDTEMTPDVAEMVERGRQKIAEIKKQMKAQTKDR